MIASEIDYEQNDIVIDDRLYAGSVDNFNVRFQVPLCRRRSRRASRQNLRIGIDVGFKTEPIVACRARHAPVSRQQETPRGWLLDRRCRANFESWSQA